VSQESSTSELEELTRRSLEAANRRDFDLLVSIYAPDAILDAEGLGTFDGRAAIRRFLEDIICSFDETVTEQEELLDLGNGVGFLVFRQSGRLVGSGGRVEQRFASVTEMAGGLIVRAAFFSDIDEARAAAERLAQERG
jgi:ketosteroid isomerase-like protein